MLFERRCAGCGKPITSCMGFVKAGDFLNLLLGTLPPNQSIRELCGRCVEIYHWSKEGILVRKSLAELRQTGLIT